jgi:LPS export ABC transporter protein LptC
VNIFRTLVLPLMTIAAAAFIVLKGLKIPNGRGVVPGADPDPELPTPGEEPDLRLGNATITEYSETGEVRYRLDAEAMARYENQEETLLGGPRLRIQAQTDGGSPWDVVAQDGAIRPVTREEGKPENIVLLRRSAVLRQLEQDSDRPLLTIRSEAIDLFPERQFAKSTTDVMIDSDVGRTYATGMEGDLKSGKLLLSSEPERPVHTIILPAQFKKQSAP